MTRIGFTGGHHTGALVVAKKLNEMGHEIVWFGHRHTMAGDMADSEEYKEVRAAGIKFISLSPPKFFNLSPPSYFYRLIKYWPKFYSLWRKEKIDLLLGFGGYLMVLPALAAFLDRIPFFIHEQTQIAGRANYWLSFLAKKIFVSWPITYPYNSKKTVYTGLPLRDSFKKFLSDRQKYSFPSVNSFYPTLLVTAGKQGSHFINQLVEESLDCILSHFNLIHQTGETTLTDDYQKFTSLAKKLNKEKKQPTTYLVYPYLSDKEMVKAYAQVDLIISRSGAHTAYELALLAKPALVIPAKFVPGGEQIKNAQFLAKIGVAKVLDQDKISSSQLCRELDRFLKEGWTKKIQSYPLILDAEKKIIEELSPYLH